MDACNGLLGIGYAQGMGQISDACNLRPRCTQPLKPKPEFIMVLLFNASIPLAEAESHPNVACRQTHKSSGVGHNLFLDIPKKSRTRKQPSQSPFPSTNFPLVYNMAWACCHAAACMGSSCVDARGCIRAVCCASGSLGC